MKHRIVLALLVLSGITASSRDAEACLCFGSPIQKSETQLLEMVREDRDESVAVFAGKVIALDTFTVTFEVDRVWKGAVPKKLTFQTGAKDLDNGEVMVSSCDFSFEVGSSYVVFGAGASLAHLRATQCTLTMLLKTADDTIKRLDLLAEREKGFDPDVALARRTPQQELAKPMGSSALIVHTDVTVPRDEQQFHLTSPEEGVKFDLNGDGIREQTAWTAPGSKLAFLALDRNGNGTIDDGSELFGNRTATGAPTGVEAMIRTLKGAGWVLAGGSRAGDPLYEKLLLWTDANHNGVSEPKELRPAGELFTQIGLAYTRATGSDANGNTFRWEGWVEVRTDGPAQGRSTTLVEGRTRGRKMLEVGFAVASSK